MQHMNPATLWLQGTVFWVKLAQMQQEAGLRMLCAFAKTIPQQNSREIGAKAEAAKATLRSVGGKQARQQLCHLPVRHKSAVAPAQLG